MYVEVLYHIGLLKYCSNFNSTCIRTCMERDSQTDSMHFTMSIKNIDCIRNVITKQEIFYERKIRKLKQRLSIFTHKTLLWTRELT